MKILIVGHFVELIDLVLHLKEEGHDVYYYTEVIRDREIGKGLVKLVQGWKTHAEDADLIFFADVYFGNTPLEWREKGKIVVGGSSLTDRLENDREYAATIFKKFGLKVPETYKFDSFEEAIEFVKKNPKRYVIKPQGQKPRYLTYVGEGPNDIILVLKHYQKLWHNKPEFVLQEYIDGVEIAVTGFFNGEKFIKPFIVNFEEKRIGAGGKGPLCGEMGTTMIAKTKSKLAEETIMKMVPYLKLADYRGFFDLNCIANEKGAYILEATCFTENTKILTPTGWKGVNDLKVGDLVYSRGDNGELTHSMVTEIKTFEYEGDLILFSSRRLNFPVTPDHTMILTDGTRITAEEAAKIPKPRICLALNGIPSHNEWMDFPEILNPFTKEELFPATQMKARDIGYLIGLYFADGRIVSDFHIEITRLSSIELLRQRVILKLKEIGVPFIEKEKTLLITCPYIVQLIQPYRKESIPPVLFNLSVEALDGFIEGFSDGNPIFAYCSSQGFFTNNHNILEQIEAIMLATGRSPTITKFYKYYQVVGAKPESIHKYMKVHREPYRGYVWCPTVEPYNSVIAKIEGQRPVITGNCRPGIPTIQIMDGIYKGKWSDLLMTLATGENKVLPFDTRWCVGVAVVSPPWPYEINSHQFGDYPIFIDPRLHFKKKIHLQDVKITEIDGEKVLVTAGNVGFTLVATGVGNTIEEAQEEVYHKVLPSIKFAEGWYRPDIGDRVKKKLTYLKKLGYI